jgi:YgiT-type zinc finger domain-containing protein
MTERAFPHDDAWDASLTRAREVLRQWRAAHPQATFTEIEAAVDAELQQVRAQLVTEAAGARAPRSDAAPTVCPTCGERLHARGTRTRTVRVAGEQAVTLRRAYLVCPGCGTGLFPPR